MISSNWAKALENNIKQYVEDGYNEHSDWSPEIYNVENDSSGILRYHNAFGPASVPKSSEGGTSTELNISNGHSFVAVVKSFLNNGEVLTGNAEDNPRQV